MKIEEIEKKVVSVLGSHIISAEVEYDIMIVEVVPTSIIKVLTLLKEDKDLSFNILTTMCGLHYPNNKNKELGVMYQIKNLITSDSLRIKAFMPNDKPNIPTITPLYPMANWMERQEFDFYGIQFVGHPNLTRILNMDDMVEHPMRKEFKLEDQTREDKEDKFFGRI